MCNVSGTERILYKGQQTRTKQKAALTAKGQIQKRSDNMEDKKDILSIAEEFIPNYKSKQLRFDFDYKQLNSSAKVVHDKEDKEFLIIFEKR